MGNELCDFKTLIQGGGKDQLSLIVQAFKYKYRYQFEHMLQIAASIKVLVDTCILGLCKNTNTSTIQIFAINCVT